MRLRAIFWVFLLAANCTWGATKPKPVGFDAAAQTMSHIAKGDLVNMNALLIAGGYLQGALLPEFNADVFEAIRKFQAANGFAPTGALTSDEVGALNDAARPFLTYWGLKAVEIGQTPTYVWMPEGLGLSGSPVDGDPQSTEYTSGRSDIVIFTSSNPGATINEAYSGTLDEMNKRRGARIIAKFLVPGKMMSIIVRLNDRRWSYVDFVRNENGIVGFTLAVDPYDEKLQSDRLHSMMLASLLSSTMQDPWLQDLPFLFAADKGADDSTQKNSGASTVNRGLITGTGIVVSTDGDILTNAHVVAECKGEIHVHAGVSDATAHIQARDKTNDLALLKTSLKLDRVAQFRAGLRLGDSVAAFGYPLSNLLATSGNFTLGSVTATAGLRDDSRYFQISAPVQPGNSGGPLLDYSGNLVGVVSAKLDALAVMRDETDGDIPQNVNFAIKSSVAQTFLEGNDVKVQTGQPGVTLSPPDLADIAKSLAVFVSCAS